MFVMQTSAMKTCFQIAECSFSYAKLSNISVTSKYLNEINIIIGQIILNPPSCFLKRDEGFFFSILTRTSRENDKGLYATMKRWRIDPSSCLDTCWVDDMAVWWFRATCFHGLKYLCVNREVLKQNFIMRTEMKASSECLYPTDVFLVSCGMGWLSFIL